MAFKCEMCLEKDAKRQVFLDGQELYVCEDCFKKTREGKRESNELYNTVTRYLTCLMKHPEPETTGRTFNVNLILCGLVDVWNMSDRKSEIKSQVEFHGYEVDVQAIYSNEKKRITLNFRVTDEESTGDNVILFDFSRHGSEAFDFKALFKVKYKNGGSEIHCLTPEDFNDDIMAMIKAVINSLHGGKDEVF